MTKTRLARRKSFQCLHRYAVEEWTPQKNQQVFGACFSPTGHGHNYELEVYFEGPVDAQTGMVMNLTEVDQILAQVLEPIHGKHLNFSVQEFKTTVPTTEAIAGYLMHRLSTCLANPSVQVVKLRLYENEDLWVDLWP